MAGKNMKNAAILLVILTSSIFISGCSGGKTGPKGYADPGYPADFYDHPSLGWYLNKTYYLYETQGINASMAFLGDDPTLVIENNSIRVGIPIPEENETYVQALKSAGLNVLYVTNATDIGGEIVVDAFLPIPKIRQLGELKFVKVVYISAKPVEG